MNLCRLVLQACCFLVAAACPAVAGPPTFRDALIVGPLAPSVRGIIASDPLTPALLSGSWTPPKEGDTVSIADGQARSWEAVPINPEGAIQHRTLRNGYAYVPVEADVEQFILLNAAGHSAVHINGDTRIGDPYSHGYVRIPVLLRAGTNDLLFRCNRGSVRLSFTPIDAPLTIDTADATLPDAIEGQSGELLGAIVVINASAEWIRGASIAAGEQGGVETVSEVAAIPPLSVAKTPFAFTVSAKPDAKECRLLLRINHPGSTENRPGTEGHISIRVRKSDEVRRVTFRSTIDGSVQYYALRPAFSAAEGLGLILSLHGASVEAQRQAECYSSKDWANIVAPTNRRPYGFDWEDWGRLDAMEVLDLAAAFLKPDSRRIYLTGHSMGGHGTWQIGAHHSGKFAAIAPSAGWISFWTYSGAAAYTGGSPIEQILKRAASTSDTLAISGNYRRLGVYILHGDRDDNVPVSQARQMRARLGEFHPDFVYYERPGAGHWWGDQCVDWPPLIDFFKARSRPEIHDIRSIDFATAHPGVSAVCDWITIEAQARPLLTSSVRISLDPGKRTISGSTANVARLKIDLADLSATRSTMRGDQTTEVHALEPGKPMTIDLDGQKISDVPWPFAEASFTLYREGDQWRIGGWAPATSKGPHRSGPFKDAFRNNMVFIVGTGGTDEERAVSLARARFDAESFWYRGNASPLIILDTEFSPEADPNRNIILYGNSDTNSAWKALFADSPIQVSTGSLIIGDRKFDSTNLACLFVRPRPGSDRACVAAIAGTGPVGMRLTQRIPYFQSGVGVPDWIVFGPEVADKGIAGVRAAGFFANDWGLSPDDSAWADAPPSTP